MGRARGAGEVTAAQGAVRLGISRERLIRLVQIGELKGRRSERGWMVEVAAVERLKQPASARAQA